MKGVRPGRGKIGRALTGRDAATCVGLVVATTVYIATKPWAMNYSDEAYYLYHAVRVLRGEVLYRDISELITPLYIDGMALLFRVFGESMATARIAAAIVQGLITGLVFLTARVVGVPWGMAAVTATIHSAVIEPVWPFATPHWLGTLFTEALLLVSLDRRRAREASWAAAQGILLGLLVLNRQPTGAAMALAVGGLFVVDLLADRRWGDDGEGVPRVAPLAVVVVSATLLVVPALGWHAAAAGVDQLVQQLVRQPLTGYREVNQFAWGEARFLFRAAQFTVVPLVQWMPLAVLPVLFVRCVFGWAGRGERAGVESLTVLLVFGAASILSILYLPDAIHLAFVMPVALVLGAETLQWLLGRVEVRFSRAVVTLPVLGFMGLRLVGNWYGAWAAFPVPHQTAFGRVDLESEGLAVAFDRMRALLDSTPGRGLFVYPGTAAWYLLTGARNPTRHDLIFPGYQNERELAGVIDALERDRTPYVSLFRPGLAKGDPILEYVERVYDCGGGTLCVRRQ